MRTLSRLVGGSFSRIQFTPDLMPSDIVGTSLVVTTANGGKDLAYRPGPIFANLILADEINRATPKTQSALLEAMAERTVSVEGQPRDLRRRSSCSRPRTRSRWKASSRCRRPGSIAS